MTEVDHRTASPEEIERGSDLTVKRLIDAFEYLAF